MSSTSSCAAPAARSAFRNATHANTFTVTCPESGSRHSIRVRRVRRARPGADSHAGRPASSRPAATTILRAIAVALALLSFAIGAAAKPVSVDDMRGPSAPLATSDVAPNPSATTRTAAEARPDASRIDETLVVLGSRTPLAASALAGTVTRFDAGDLRDSRMPFVADLLRTIPGAALSRTGAIGGVTQLRIRGSEANHTLVLLDGLEANDPATGSEFDFAHLRSATVERVEVLPGPSGALWGSDAVAGAVHLRTPRAREGLDWGVSGGFGSHGTSEGTARIGHGSERSSFNAVFDHYDTDGTNVARSGDEDDGYRISTVALHGAALLTDRIRAQAIVRSLRANVEFDPTPFPDFLPADGDLETDLERTLAGVHLDYDPEAGADLDWAHRLTLEVLRSSYDDRNQGTVTDQRRGDRQRIALQSAVDYAALLPGDQRLAFAAEIEREEFAQRGTATDFGDPNQNQQLTHRAVVGEWRWQMPAGVQISAVLRQDFNDAFDDGTHWRLGVRGALPLALGDGWARISRATKNPVFTERFGFTPDSFLGNPDLQPERSEGIELGWSRSFVSDAVRTELVWYRDRLENEIDGFVFDPATSAFTARNRDRDSRREGIEARVELRPTEATSVALRYAHVDASEPDPAGGQVREVRRPRHSGSVSAVHRFAAQPLVARVDAAWNGERDDTDFATFPATKVVLDDYWLIGAALNWTPRPGTTLFLRADNLADETFEDVFGYRGPGRALNVGFELRAR